VKLKRDKGLDLGPEWAGEWALVHCMVHPVAFAELILPEDPSRPTDWVPEEPGAQVRYYQLHPLAFDTVFRTLTNLERHILGSVTWVGGRTTGKSLFTFLVEPLLRALRWSSYETLICALDMLHVGDRLRGLKDYAELHPLIREFSKTTREHPKWWMVFKNGSVIHGRIEGMRRPGKDFEGLHPDCQLIEETQLMTEKGMARLRDAQCENGAVKRHVGVPDGRRGTPFSVLINDPQTPGLIRIESWVSPHWTSLRKAQSVKEHGGEHSPSYQHNIEGVEGTAAEGTFDMDDVYMCTTRTQRLNRMDLHGKDVEHFLRPGELYNIVQCAELMPQLWPVPIDACRRVIGADIGYEDRSVLRIYALSDKGHMQQFQGRDAEGHAKREWKWHLVGEVDLVRVDYTYQAQILDYMLEFYSNADIKAYAGVDATGEGGKAVRQHLLRWHQNEPDFPVLLPPVRYAKTMPVYVKRDPETGQVEHGPDGCALFEELPVKFQAVRLLRQMLRDRQLVWPNDGDAQAEYSAMRTMRTDQNRIVYKSGTTDHIVAADLTFAVAVFQVETWPSIRDEASVRLETYMALQEALAGTGR